MQISLLFMIFNCTSPSEKTSSFLFLGFFPPDKKIRALRAGEDFGSCQNDRKGLARKLIAILLKT